MPTKLTELELYEVSLVERGANQGAKMSLYKSQKEEPQMEELEKELQELKARLEASDATNAELVKSLEEAQASIVPEEEPIKKEELDPRVAKALDEADEIRKAHEASTKEFADYKNAQLVKDIDGKVSEYTAIFKSDEERSTAVDVLKCLSIEERDFVFDLVGKGTQVIEDAAKTISKELGESGDSEDSSVVEKVQLDAEALVDKDSSLSIHKARMQVVEKLSKEDRFAYNKGDK